MLQLGQFLIDFLSNTYLFLTAVTTNEHICEHILFKQYNLVFIGETIFEIFFSFFNFSEYVHISLGPILMIIHIAHSE
jgi:hypothetical protein